MRLPVVTTNVCVHALRGFGVTRDSLFPSSHQLREPLLEHSWQYFTKSCYIYSYAMDLLVEGAGMVVRKWRLLQLRQALLEYAWQYFSKSCYIYSCVMDLFLREPGTVMRNWRVFLQWLVAISVACSRCDSFNFRRRLFLAMPSIPFRDVDVASDAVSVLIVVVVSAMRMEWVM